ncbi:MAG: hypothetical protein NTW55_03035 [Planctomycetota bacterium]|nr:hypothetical protein [Planctomycetota bacterium]
MKRRFMSFIVFALLSILTITSICSAVDTVAIGAVRDKAVLDSSDFKVIDDFIASALSELSEVEDFTATSKIRAELVRYSRPVQSEQLQYTDKFFESAYNRMSEALKTTSQLTDPARKFKMTLNLLIIMDGFGNTRLADLAIGLLKDENPIIRYWAVHAITNLRIAGHLNAEAANNNPKPAEQIVTGLKSLVEKANPDTLALMVKFTADTNAPQADELLLQIADMRIKRYADWSVEYELLDESVLGALCQSMSEDAVTSNFARRFGQLYSYVIQRYVKGQDVLSDMQKQQLASVIVGTERSCMGLRLGMIQSTIRTAVQQNDFGTIMGEHDKLLGSESGPGQIELKLNFDYGQSTDGSKHLSPLVLSDPPKVETDQAGDSSVSDSNGK